VDFNMVLMEQSFHNGHLSFESSVFL
jgi:hypothetical protein